MSPGEFEPARVLLEGAKLKTRPKRHATQAVFEAVIHMLETEKPWRALPTEYPPWRTVHEHFVQWTTRGRRGNLVLEALRLLDRRDLEPSLLRRLERNRGLSRK